MLDLDTLTPEERELAEVMTYSSWGQDEDQFVSHDEAMIALLYAPDAISMPAEHPALRGHDEIRDWYAKRTGDYPLYIDSEVDSVDVVGEVAVVTGVFRACRPARQGVAGLDHAGRYLAVMRKVDGAWKMWRDMDTSSPDADVFFGLHPRGW